MLPEQSVGVLPARLQRENDQVCDQFEAAWQTSGERPKLEGYLAQKTGAGREPLLRELLRLELEYRRRQTESPQIEEYLVRFPQDESAVRWAFRLAPESQDSTNSHVCGYGVPAQLGADRMGALSTCNYAVDLNQSSPSTINEPVGTGGPPSGGAPDPRHPAAIGRYRIEGILGQGGFGCVYLAHDETLRRRVAIKVPHARHVASAADAAPYLAEAQTLASLDHPHIVPVYDIGTTPEFPCYVVSKYIDGANLAWFVEQGKSAPDQAASIVAVVADALHYAHKQGLIHRDIKPHNILIDRQGVPYLSDFGLALREEDVGKGSGYAGTPAYWSPEQAKGEGHRADGRADIFSLGIVLYELLTGRRPFGGDSMDELCRQILSRDTKPPRQLDDCIPRELERICLKALSKTPKERYSTAKDLADDLRASRKSQPTPIVDSGVQERRQMRTSFSLPGMTCSVAVALSLLVSGVVLFWRQNDPDLVSSVIPPQAESPLRVLDFTIDYIRSEPDSDRRLGELGRDWFEARQGDAVTLKARFSRPAYAYLLALRADGQVELCWPEDESIAPPLAADAFYPSINPEHMYGLDEGIGQWAFLAVASSKPLPPFAQWSVDHGLPPWQPIEGGSGSVWEFTVDHVWDITPTSNTRGKGRIAQGKEPLAQVARWFASIPQIDVVEGRAFIARPRP